MKTAKTCIKGYSCGLTCINRERSCSKELTGQSIQLCSALKSLIRGHKIEPDMGKLLSMDFDKGNKIAESITRYTGSDYVLIRAKERAGLSDPDIDNINEFLTKAPKYDGGAIYRGIPMPQSTLDSLFKVGEQIELDAMSSHSSGQKIGENFALKTKVGQVPVLLEIETNKSGCSIKNWSSFDYEEEVLVPKGTRYEILERSTRNLQRPTGAKTINVLKIREV